MTLGIPLMVPLPLTEPVSPYSEDLGRSSGARQTYLRTTAVNSEKYSHHRPHTALSYIHSVPYLKAGSTNKVYATRIPWLW